MIEFVRTILTGQFAASLCMMDQCLRACPLEHWEGKVANGTFRWVAYHTLFWVDVYLSPEGGGEEAFVLRDFHERGGDERADGVCPGLGKDEALAYVSICRQKMLETLAAETAESIQGPGGFPGRPKTRGELHIYNLRHLQHHTGQLSAYLRRVDPSLGHGALPWVGTGWKSTKGADQPGAA